MAEGRYANSPKVKSGKVEKPVKGAAMSEDREVDSPPGAADDKGVIKTPDKGTQPGADKAQFGDIAERHKSEHKDMLGRHKAEHEQMIGRHAEESTKMAARHHKEMAEVAPDKDETKPTSEAKADAGKPKELGKAEHVDGTKGAEP